MEERIKFAKKLTSLLLAGRKVIFADETSYRVTAKPRINKTW